MQRDGNPLKGVALVLAVTLLFADGDTLGIGKVRLCTVRCQLESLLANCFSSLPARWRASAIYPLVELRIEIPSSTG